MSNLSNVSLSRVAYPVTADEAISKLISSTEEDSNKLGFMIQVASGTKLTPFLRNVWNETAAVFSSGGNCASTTTTSSSSESGLSDGTIAGIAMWMLVLGIGIGIVGTLCTFALISRKRKRGTLSFTRSVPYKRQDEDVVVSTT